MPLPRVRLRALMIAVAVVALVLTLAVRIAENPRLGIGCLIVWLASQPIIMSLFLRDLVRASRVGEMREPTLRGWTLLLIVLIHGLLVSSLIGISMLPVLG